MNTVCVFMYFSVFTLFWKKQNKITFIFEHLKAFWVVLM